MISYVSSVWSATRSVHGQTREQCMISHVISAWYPCDQCMINHVISVWSARFGFFTGCVVCKYCVPLCSFSFNALKRVSEKAIFHSDEIQSIKCTFYGTCFWHQVYELFACVCSVTQSCPTLCELLDCSPPGSSVHGVLQAKILEWIPYPTLGDPKPRWFCFFFFSKSLTVLH